MVVGRSKTNEETALPGPEPQRAARRIWHGVINGELMVERHYNRGGRRFLVVQPMPPEGKSDAALTAREREVLSYRAYGQSLKRIGAELKLSIPTIQRALSSALKKLGLSSELELAAVFGAGLRKRRE